MPAHGAGSQCPVLASDIIRNATQMTHPLAEQPEILYLPNSICFNKDDGKKQTIKKNVPEPFYSDSAIIDTPKTLACDTSILPVPLNGMKNGPPFDKQPIGQEPPLHMLLPSNDLALITAFSYEWHTGLVPLLSSVPAEAEHISVRSFMPKQHVAPSKRIVLKLCAA